jgi:ABC-type Fe2+-enterobactin transport system substrate-binding protein
MFKKENFLLRDLKIQVENLTSGLSLSPQQGQSLRILEIDAEKRTFTLGGSTGFCATGHQLQVSVDVIDTRPLLQFVASGIVRQIYEAEGDERVALQILQFDKGEWAKFLKSTASAFEQTQNLFKNMKD